MVMYKDCIQLQVIENLTKMFKQREVCFSYISLAVGSCSCYFSVVMAQQC